MSNRVRRRPPRGQRVFYTGIRERAWSERERGKPSRKRAPVPVEHALFLDAETSVDETQRALFYNARHSYVDDDFTTTLIAEYLVYADDLPSFDGEGFRTIVDYVEKGKRLTVDENGRLKRNPDSAYSSRVDMAAALERTEQARRSGRMSFTPQPELILVSESEFRREVFFPLADPGRQPAGGKAAHIVGFNLPFDLSRLATNVSETRGSRNSKDGKTSKNAYANGFSFEYGELGHVKIAKCGARGHMYDLSPRRFGRNGQHHKDAPKDSYFLDLAQLVFALNSKSYSLAKAGEAYETEYRKSDVEQDFGHINDNHITYCRDDVRATESLFTKVMQAYRKHPIELCETRAYSAASMGKAYLRKMGVPIRLDVQPGFSREILGYVMSSLHGARTECHARRVVLPVVVGDVTSEYTTVNANYGLWNLLTAKRIVHRWETEGVQRFLDSVTLEDLYNPNTWKQMVGFVSYIPDGDLTVIRAAHHGEDGQHCKIETSPAYGDQPVWRAIADVAASKILTGEAPRIESAFRLYPEGGKIDTLRPVDFMGDPQLRIDPRESDLFAETINLRLSILNNRRNDFGHPDNCQCSRCVHPKDCICDGCQKLYALKIFANASSYGIWIEFNSQAKSSEPASVTVHNANPESYSVKVDRPEDPGDYSFPPIGALITAGGRLFLAMAEAEVTRAGGTWMFCDTDSMAIVASKDGGEIQVPCHTCAAGHAVKVLTYGDVQKIFERFNALSPYDSERVGDDCPIFKMEQPKDPNGPQVYAYALSSKRYALLTVEDNKGPEILRIGSAPCWMCRKRSATCRCVCSVCEVRTCFCDCEDVGKAQPDLKMDVVKKESREHGLGQYMNPINPNLAEEPGGRSWVEEAWLWMIRKDLGVINPRPSWFDRPAMVKTSISTQSLYRPFEHWNMGRSYAESVKPYNFLMKPTVVQSLGAHEVESRPALISPFRSDAGDMWADLEYIDRDNPEHNARQITTHHRLETTENYLSDDVLVKSYAEVLFDYQNHPEVQFVDAHGEPCGPPTQGILHRRHVVITKHDRKSIGKESNEFDERVEGLVSEEESTLDYGVGGKTNALTELILPVLVGYSNRGLSEAIMENVGIRIDPTTVGSIRQRETRSPQDHRLKALKIFSVRIACRMLGEDIQDARWSNPLDDYSPTKLGLSNWLNILTAYRDRFHTEDQKGWMGNVDRLVLY